MNRRDSFKSLGAMFLGAAFPMQLVEAKPLIWLPVEGSSINRPVHYEYRKGDHISIRLPPVFDPNALGRPSFNEKTYLVMAQYESPQGTMLGLQAIK